MSKYKQGTSVETTLRSWKLGKTKNKGTKFVKLIFNNYIEWTGWLTPKTEKRTIETLEMLGFKGSNLRMLAQDGALDTSKPVLAVIGESREYNGKTYYSADWINDPNRALGGWDGDNMTDDDLDDFDVDTSGYIADAQDIDPPASSSKDFMSDQKTPESNVNYATDDIPF